MSHPVILASLLSSALLLTLAACGPATAPERSQRSPFAETAAAPSPAVKRTPATPADEPPKPGVKPHYVKCNPDRPGMPCTPETPPFDLGAPDAPKPGVKPHYVKCDPARPEMPCTPESKLPEPR